jgi:hypothetical protein
LLDLTESEKVKERFCPYFVQWYFVPLLPDTPISVCQMRKSVKLSVKVEFLAARVLASKRLFIHSCSGKWFTSEKHLD